MIKILRYLSKNQFRLQSIIFWFFAFMHSSTDKFWYFAFAALIFDGIQDILEELRKSNKQENEQS